jgi:Acyltransferase family
MTSVTSAPQEDRLTWIEDSTGVAIILIVIGNCLRGLVESGLLPEDGWFHVVDAMIYSFHMAMLFVLAGLTFVSWAMPMEPLPFVLSRLKGLVWPMTLWTWMYYVVKIISGKLANNPTPWSEFPFNPLPPKVHYWDLWTFFLVSLAVYAIRPIWLRNKKVLWPWLVLLVIACYLSKEIPLMGFNPDWFALAFHFSPYFIAGILMARRHWPKVGWPGVLVALLVLIPSVLLPLKPLDHYDTFEHTIYLIIAFTASVAVIQIMREINLQKPTLLRSFGGAWLAIYCAHPIFSPAFRMLLTKLGVTNILPHVIGGTLIGLFAPLLMLAVAKRLRIAKFLGI